jgi:hypothetical protein
MLLAACCWWLVSATPDSASSLSTRALADSLFCNAEYSAAATEYERLVFLHSADPLAGSARVMLVRSYARGGELDRAEAVLAELPAVSDSAEWEARFDLALGYARQKHYGDARAELANLQASARDSLRSCRVHRQLGWLGVEETDFPQAALEFAQSGDSLLAGECRRRARLPARNPTLGLLASTFLPGSGEVYAGNVRLGLAAFAANAAVIAGVVYCVDRKLYLDAALLTALFFGRFYGGSRNNAWDLAHEFNERAKRKAARELEERYGRGRE